MDVTSLSGIAGQHLHLKFCAMLSHTQLESYLEHIHLPKQDLPPSLDSLTTVHKHHTRWIPFANVTVARAPTQLVQLKFPLGTPDTTTEGVMDKLIERGW